MALEPVRRHLYIPQGKDWSANLQYPLTLDISGYILRLRIRKSFSKETVITTDNSTYLDASYSVDTLNHIITLTITDTQSTTLRGNVSYDDLPLTDDRQVDIASLQGKKIAALPGNPYVYELEQETPTGDVQALLFGGVLVPYETNRLTVA
jgi:hypothetical protein